jgi:hypothetical protein
VIGLPFRIVILDDDHLGSSNAAVDEVICDVCNKPVDVIERDYDIRRRETIYTVYCHGDREEVRLSDATVAGAEHIGVGRAFAKKRIGQGARLLEAAKGMDER